MNNIFSNMVAANYACPYATLKWYLTLGGEVSEKFMAVLNKTKNPGKSGAFVKRMFLKIISSRLLSVFSLSDGSTT